MENEINHFPLNALCNKKGYRQQIKKVEVIQHKGLIYVMPVKPKG